MPRRGKRSTSQKMRWRKAHSTDHNMDADTPSCSAPNQMDVTPSLKRPLTKDPLTVESPAVPAKKKNKRTVTRPTYVSSEPSPDRADPLPRRCGTGIRCRSTRWPASLHTKRSCKLLIPPESPDKIFVLVVGDSHLRAIVDGVVPMPEGKLSFGFLASPGATADDLRTEFQNTVLLRMPDAICLLAPSNELTSGNTVSEAGVDFQKLLHCLCSRSANVFVFDFPPRLNVDVQLQTLLHDEFHRQAAKSGVPYVNTTQHFSMCNLDLWCRDGIHLSDNFGTPIFVDLLWNSTMQVVSAVSHVPVSQQKSAAPRVRRTPKVICPEEVEHRPTPSPFDWALIGRNGRISPVHDQDDTSGSSQSTPLTQDKVQLRNCSVVLNPMWFSKDLLDILGDGNPIICSVPEGRVNTSVTHHSSVGFEKKPGKTKVTISPRRRLATSPPADVGAVTEDICSKSSHQPHDVKIECPVSLQQRDDMDSLKDADVPMVQDRCGASEHQHLWSI